MPPAAAERTSRQTAAAVERRHPLRLRMVVVIVVMVPAIILTWMVKALLLRYGGLKAHQRALPFFLGLIVGDATVGLIGTVLLHAVLRQ